MGKYIIRCSVDRRITFDEAVEPICIGPITFHRDTAEPFLFYAFLRDVSLPDAVFVCCVITLTILFSCASVFFNKYCRIDRF